MRLGPVQAIGHAPVVPQPVKVRTRLEVDPGCCACQEVWLQYLLIDIVHSAEGINEEVIHPMVEMKL